MGKTVMNERAKTRSRRPAPISRPLQIRSYDLEANTFLFHFVFIFDLVAQKHLILGSTRHVYCALRLNYVHRRTSLILYTNVSLQATGFLVSINYGEVNEVPFT